MIQCKISCGVDYGFQGNAEFDRVTGDIQSEVNTHLGGLDGGANSSGVSRSLSDANNTIFDNRDTVSGDIRKVQPTHSPPFFTRQ